MKIILLITLFFFSQISTDQTIQCTLHEKLQTACTLDYNPVCATQASSPISLLITHKTFPNRCTACADFLTISITMGPCPNLQAPLWDSQCSEEEMNAKICTLEYRPVCGISNDRSYRNQKRTTFGNRCGACANPQTQFVMEGECSQFEQSIRVCNPKDKTGMPCTREYDPVCARFWDGNRIEQTFATGCVACTMEGVFSFRKGTCVSSE